MRRPDKPGTYRVVARNGKWMLSGVRLNGSRVKMRDLSRVDAERMGAQIFGAGVTPVIPGVTHKFALGRDGEEPPAGAIPVVDDWGLPIRVKTEDVANLNASLGITPQPVVNLEEEAAKKAKRAKNAHSLMELAGVTWAAGSVWAGRKLCDNTGREAGKPNQTQVQDLRDVTKETLTEWFGDHEVKPWQMMILLSFGIPISMFLQAPRKPQSKIDAEKAEKANLKSVP